MSPATRELAPKDKVDPAPEPTPRKVRLTLDLTPKMKDILDQLATEAGATQAEILRRAIALLWGAKNAERRGESLALIDDAGNVKARLVGF